MAPRRNVAFLSGMTRSASICCSTPRPPHAGQAPNGLLNENSRGSISGMVKPDTGQAKRSEKTRRSGPLWSWILAVFFSACSDCSLSPLAGGGVGGGGFSFRRHVARRRPLTRIPSRSDLSPQAGRGGSEWRIGELRYRQTVGEFEALFERIGKSRRDVRAHHDPIHHHVDIVLEFLVERR